MGRVDAIFVELAVQFGEFRAERSRRQFMGVLSNLEWQWSL